MTPTAPRSLHTTPPCSTPLPPSVSPRGVWAQHLAARLVALAMMAGVSMSFAVENASLHQYGRASVFAVMAVIVFAVMAVICVWKGARLHRRLDNILDIVLSM